MEGNWFAELDLIEELLAEGKIDESEASFIRGYVKGDLSVVM